jgi:uncharacterized membrane protein
MSDIRSDVVPCTIIVATFDGKQGAHDALGALKKARKPDGLEIEDAVALRKDEKGRVRVSETGDWSGRRGMAVGGIAGGALGVLTGGIGWLALGGAAAAGLTSRLRDSGFDNAELKEVVNRLDPNTSALLLVGSNASADRCVELVKEAGCDAVFTHRLDVDTTVDLTVTSALEIIDREGTTV